MNCKDNSFHHQFDCKTKITKKQKYVKTKNRNKKKRKFKIVKKLILFEKKY